jgi:hypothetical protein
LCVCNKHFRKRTPFSKILRVLFRKNLQLDSDVRPSTSEEITQSTAIDPNETVPLNTFQSTDYEQPVENQRVTVQVHNQEENIYEEYETPL